jgi:hypothetical protein
MVPKGAQTDSFVGHQPGGFRGGLLSGLSGLCMGRQTVAFPSSSPLGDVVDSDIDFGGAPAASAAAVEVRKRGRQRMFGISTPKSADDAESKAKCNRR